MTKAVIDDELWSRIEPLLPKRRRRNRRYAGRKPTPDRAGLTDILSFARMVGVGLGIMDGPSRLATSATQLATRCLGGAPRSGAQIS